MWSAMSNGGLRVKLNSAGVRAMLKSSEMQGILKDQADAIVQRCGDGYEIDPFVGKRRANVSVRTKSKKAVKDNSENNTLLKSLKG